MTIKTALILCAGYGKRLKPLTTSKPKPLIEINNSILLNQAIELVFSLGIEKLKINTFYLSDQIINFLKFHKFKNNIEIINDGKEILDTGGGIKNMIRYVNGNDFLVMNPDTLWVENYKHTITKMINYYEKKNLDNLLLVVNKKYSFDKRFSGDFQFREMKLYRDSNLDYIYTGVQILNKNLFREIKEKKFSVNVIWDNQIKKKNLNGFESHHLFEHLTDLEIYNKLIKK